MYSMWNAPSDLDYYSQFNLEPPEDEELELELEPEDPFEVPLLCHDAEDDGVTGQGPALTKPCPPNDFPEVA